MNPDKQSSKLLQYLGFSVDLNLGDIFGEKVEDLWLGYDIHHRSAVFENASEYGRFKGGSNYNTVYLQYHF
jgi:outer membrane protein